MKEYKIRHKKTGLFKTSGGRPWFTKKGHTWTSIGALKLHLNSASGESEDWEVVEYLMIEDRIMSVQEVG